MSILTLKDLRRFLDDYATKNMGRWPEIIELSEDENRVLSDEVETLYNSKTTKRPPRLKTVYGIPVKIVQSLERDE